MVLPSEPEGVVNALTGRVGGGRSDKTPTVSLPMSQRIIDGPTAPTLTSSKSPGRGGSEGPMAFVKKHGANHAEDEETWAEGDVARSLNGMGQAGTNGALATEPAVGGVRRLTPTECERLQGFPDGWTVLRASTRTPSDGTGSP